MSTAIIQAKAIKKSFKKQEVLKGIDFEVYEGEIIALVGANGAGKSILIKIMNNLIRPSSGNIQIFGQSPADKNLRNRMGVMLQDNITLQRIKVIELLNLAASYYDRLISSLELVSCNVIEDLIPLYAEDMLSEDSIKMVEAHLDKCRECREYLKELKEIDGLPVETDKEPLKKIRKILQKKSGRQSFLRRSLPYL